MRGYAAAFASRVINSCFFIVCILQQVSDRLCKVQIFRTVVLIRFPSKLRELVIFARRPAAFLLQIGREQSVRLQLPQDRIDRAIRNVNVLGEEIGDLIAIAVALVQQRQHAQLQHALFILRVHPQLLSVWFVLSLVYYIH